MRDPVEEFLEIEKQAAIDPRWGQFGGQLALAAGTMAAGSLVGEVYRGVRNAITRSTNFKRMMAYNPALEKEDRTRVQTIFNTLHNVSPDLAKDPLVANSWVKRMMYQDEYVDPKTLSDLATAQQRMVQAGEQSFGLSPAIMKGLEASPFMPVKGGGGGSGGGAGGSRMRHQS